MCSQGFQNILNCKGISTHAWVKSWGINITLSKTSRCFCQCRPVRPVGSKQLAVRPGLVRPVPQITQTGQGQRTPKTHLKGFT